MELPLDFIKRMKDMLGSEYENFEKAFCEGESYSAMRINTLKDIPKELKAVTDKLEKVPWCDFGYYVGKDTINGKSPFHASGLFYFQEPSAMSAVAALGIDEGDFVLDLCAAPGGKATYAAQMLNGAGLLIANEIVKKRSAVLSENIERMGIKNAVVTNETPARLAEKYPRFFDKIIVDAPCSGEGMFRKEPKALVEWSVEHTESCAVRQKLIIDSAIDMLSPGGRLIYSTCTFAPCENEGVAEYILSKPDMRLVPIDMPYFSPGRGEWIGSDMDFSAAKRIFPHKNKGEGHFLALFEKCGEKRKKVFKEKITEPDKSYREFEKEYLNVKFSGNFVMFGENLYLLPQGADIDKIKVERAGIYMGQCKKGRFEPSHALALALKKGEIKNTFETDSPEKYLRGETLISDISGWCAVTYCGVNLGWAKGSQGILKNKYPKQLREI